jgi:putative hydroxymethylpyrimidine transport system permease protein
MYMAFIILLWQLLCSVFTIPEYLLPSPFDIGKTFISHWNIVRTHALYTSIEITAGLLLSIACALLCGLIYTFWPPFERWIRPVLVVMQTMPSFLFMPLLILWLGFGVLPKMIIVTLTGFFPLTLAFLDGLKRPPIEWLELESLFQRTPFRSFLYVRLPASLPAFFTGLRWACLQGSIAVIAADWLGSSHGLGYLILSSYSRIQIPLLFVCVIILIIFAQVLMLATKWMERRLVFW